MENLKQSKLRLGFSSFILIIFIGVVGYKIILTGGVEKKNNHHFNSKINYKVKEKIVRGEIRDRNGYVLATTIQTNDLIFNPSVIKNPKLFARQISNTLKNLSVEETHKKLNSNKKYIKLVKNISPSDYMKILKLGIPSTSIEKSFVRKYPSINLASHVIGNVDTEDKGISGIELNFDHTLSRGKHVSLSINSGIQNILRNLIKSQIDKFQAEGGAGILIDANNGEIIASVSLPDYDNNSVSNIGNLQKFNKATKGTYELGSTLKIFNAAIALESGLVRDNDLIDVTKPLKISSFTINDDKQLNFSINLPEILVYSSNIGSAKIAQLVGSKIQQKYLDLLGFNKALDLELIEIGKARFRKDNKLSTIMTMSYGYGIRISPLHLASGTSTIINGGYLIKPSLLPLDEEKKLGKQIFSNNTSEKMRSILRLVVSNQFGTGKNANATGYLVGGKTGTAHKSIANGYSKKEKIVAFTGGFPITNPKFVFTIMIDNPKPQKFSMGRATGGWVVAPIVKKLVMRIAPILKIYPSLKNEYLNKNLINYKIRGNEL